MMIRVVTAIASCSIGSVCGVALSQESGQAEADDDVRTPTEEVIVRGRSRAALRFRLERAEEAVFDRFNEINSNDEFDIHCRREEQTGSAIPRRVCQPNFWREAQAQAGQETVHRLQGSFAFGTQQFVGEAFYKHRRLEEEMQRLADEDEHLLGALARLEDLEQALEQREVTSPSPASTSAHEVTADEEALPYDAARMAEVRVGSEPWNHVLTHRTFTIAQVYGEIRATEVDCDEGTQSLQWEAGVEWTLPDDWGSCTLLVDAAPSTTFALYEFE